MRRAETLPSRLYAITDRRLCAPQPLLDAVHELLEAGVRFVQVREKDLNVEALGRLAEPIVRLCCGYRASVLINAHAEVALSVGADGVHLPADSGPVGEVRSLGERPLFVGCSTHDLEAVRAREAQGADFVTFSPIYPTGSKPGYGPAVGTEGLRRAAAVAQVPVFALGGVSPERVRECLEAGAFGVAVMSGLMRAGGRAARARAYLEALGE